MTQLTNWQLFHLYRRLVENGVAKPLLCPECETQLVTRIGVDDEPVLWCYGCLVILKPGSDVLSQVRAVVTEHYA